MTDALPGSAFVGSGVRTLALCAAFFASGASALAFENLWFHQAGLVFGNSVWASGLVLSGFMAGMALGNLLAARRSDSARNGLRLYAALELAIAATGVGLVYVLPAFSAAIATGLARLGDATPGLQLARLVFAFALLLPPSTAMGMTLPLLVAALLDRGDRRRSVTRADDGDFGRALGLLYGTNTAGAVAGCLGVEIACLPALGIRGSAWFAAALNLLAAGVTWALSNRARATVLSNRASATPSAESAPEPALAPTPRAPDDRARLSGLRWPVAAFLSGFALLGLEVVWLRFAMLYINDTPLAFAAMLAVVLGGIAAGGFVAALWSGRFARADDNAALVAYAAGVLGIAGYASYSFFLRHFYVLDQGVFTVFVLMAPLVLPTSLASGVLFSLLGSGLSRTLASDAGATGRLSFANTLGAGLGSLCAGFLLLPGLGMERALFSLFALYGVIGIVLGLTRELPAKLRYAAPVLFTAALLSFPFGKMSSWYVHNSAAHWMTKHDSLADVREGLTATLIHVVHRFYGLVLFDQLATNAYSMTTNDYGSRRYMKLFVLLPRAVHPRIERALLVGYGIGNTAEAMLRSQSMRRVDVVDISSDILAMSRNMRTRPGPSPLSDRRVHVHIEDGRQFLQATALQFDLITGEPPPPVIAGVVNLYTQEYFQLIRERLAPGGIASYWLPLMNLSAQSAKSLIRGFCAAFPDCSLWHGTDRNFMLMGTRNAAAAGTASAAAFASDFADPAWHDELESIGLEQPGQLGALFIGDAEYLRELTAGAAPLTDDRPKLMHQAGTREERDALLWQWRDTTAARQRFIKSALIARLWPEPAREDALRYFDTQRLIDDLLFPGQSNARQSRVLHQVLNGTRLRFPALLLLKSDPDVQRALQVASPELAQRPELLRHRVAGLLADRDFPGALELLERMPDDKLAIPDLRQYVRYVVRRQSGQQPMPE